MTLTDVKREVKDIVETAEEREFWTVVREHERPPFYHESEGINNRLNKAARVVYDERITPNSDGSYTVEGSEKRTYRVAESCSCPNSQKGKSKWCYHMCAVALYVEWKRRLGPRPPVELGTLRAGTLPLPPVTIDERLAQAQADDQGPLTTGLRQSLEWQEAQGDVMPDDDPQYIPEPDDAPVAVLEASDAEFPPLGQPARSHLERPTPEGAHVTAAVAAGHALLPALDAGTLEHSMQAYAAQRAVVTRYIKEQMSEGIDYYTLTIKGRVSKATLSKAGSEKFLSLFQLHAAFQQDHATWQMLGSKDGVLCYTCTLMTRSGEVIGEGRGARSVSQDGGDINKAIKMATKSAQVDAVLRTGALSDVFTQDLDPETAPEPAQPPPAKPTAQSQDLRKRIWAEVNRQAPQVKTQDAAEAWVHERTGLTMEPDNYAQILAQLTAGVRA